MLHRRDLLLGLPLMAAAGGALALTPRNRLNLLGKEKLENLIPLNIGSWAVTPSNALVLPPPREGSLTAELYSQQVSRLYISESKIPVMLVIAYGDTQSDSLQLHRPEVCYSAVGFEISNSRPIDVPLGGQSHLPARALVATSNDRVEPIVYWTRIGDFLPVSGGQQRAMRLRTEMAGYVADGVLVRMSTVGEASDDIFTGLGEFAAAMLAESDPRALPALVGRPLAAELEARPRARKLEAG